MADIQIFTSEMFGEIRTIVEDDKVLFCATDVARALGYAVPRKAVFDHCRCVLKRNVPHPQSPDKQIEMSFIPEGDVYRLITHSKLPAAEKFESWIFDNIVPSVLKHGAYMTPETIEKVLYNPDFIIGIASALKEEQNKNTKLTATVTSLNNDIDCLTGEVNCLNRELAIQDKVIEQSKPKVEFYNAVSDTKDCLRVREFAKLCHKSGIDIGQNKLYKWFRENGYMNSHNEPYQQYINAGYFIVREYHFFVGNEPRVSLTPYITGKGQQYFLRKLKELIAAA